MLYSLLHSLHIVAVTCILLFIYFNSFYKILLFLSYYLSYSSCGEFCHYLITYNMCGDSCYYLITYPRCDVELLFLSYYLIRVVWNAEKFESDGAAAAV
jgi:hypothetical protein